METRLRGTCSAPEIYSALDPSRPLMEARAVALAAYSENDLPADQAARVRAHLQKCTACERFLAEFEDPESKEVAFAVCPSNAALDSFVFDGGALNPAESARIEKHLKECPLCREETAWLRHLEEPPSQTLKPYSSVVWMKPLLAAAAVVFLALAAILFWRGGHPVDNAEELRALAVIKEPSQIDYAELDQTSTPLDQQTDTRYEQAVAEFKAGKYREASEDLERVLKTEPTHSGAVFLLGYSYYKLNEPEKAFDLCNRAENIKPHSYERCMFLVNIALKTGNFRRALTEISALYHAAPEDPGIRDMYFKITALMPDQKKI